MYIDIAVNLTDDMFQGIYHDKKRHDCDLAHVVQRAKDAKCNQMIVLAGSIEDAENCATLCDELDPSGSSLYTTIGVHPTRCDSIVGSNQKENLITDFKDFIAARQKRVAAFGEFGLDYDRLHFCSRETQLRGFELQLRVVEQLRSENIDLPLLLHLRNAFDDFVLLMNKYRHVWETCGGVVHSFTGTRDEMKILTDMGLYIGLNGCSLRTEESLQDVVPFIPLDKLMFETDSPYCDVRPTHPGYKFLDAQKSVKPDKFQMGSMVKNRNEPACIHHVATIVARARGMDVTALGNVVHENTLRLFKQLVRRYAN
jgi:TatD DNase family protein